MIMSKAKPQASRATYDGISLHEEDGSQAADTGLHTRSDVRIMTTPKGPDVKIAVAVNRRIP
jgi:hypothetical protein